ncbi:MAG: S41 family peptidase [Candidatus Sulfotelmatobacter sp.]|jgi:C-terminal processing protease CtpA/Prc
MIKLCNFTVILLLALYCRAEQRPAALTPQQVDQIVDRLLSGLGDYVFPEVSEKLQSQIRMHRSEYRALSDSKALAARLTEDLRAVGLDHHLEVSFGEELGVQKEPTPAEKQHAHAFDLANGHGVRSGRRLPGNVGYVDLAYFSPDSEAGTALAAAMQLVSGADALIVDLRRNGGGSGETATALLSYFFEEPIQLSSIVERKNGQLLERQKWTMPYVAGPRYLGKPVFVLTSRRTHSAAELCAYDLKNTHRATLVGERTAGDANSSTGEIALGYGFSALIPNGQTKSPITHTNWEGTGVEPDVAATASDVLVAAYKLALEDMKPSVESEELTKERQLAVQDPQAALAEEITGFQKK